jgi:hypothetical protein
MQGHNCGSCGKPFSQCRCNQNAPTMIRPPPPKPQHDQMVGNPAQSHHSPNPGQGGHNCGSCGQPFSQCRCNQGAPTMIRPPPPKPQHDQMVGNPAQSHHSPNPGQGGHNCGSCGQPFSQCRCNQGAPTMIRPPPPRPQHDQMVGTPAQSHYAPPNPAQSHYAPPNPAQSHYAQNPVHSQAQPQYGQSQSHQPHIVKTYRQVNGVNVPVCNHCHNIDRECSCGALKCQGCQNLKADCKCSRCTNCHHRIAGCTC